MFCGLKSQKWNLEGMGLDTSGVKITQHSTISTSYQHKQAGGQRVWQPLTHGSLWLRRDPPICLSEHTFFCLVNIVNKVCLLSWLQQTIKSQTQITSVSSVQQRQVCVPTTANGFSPYAANSTSGSTEVCLHCCLFHLSTRLNGPPLHPIALSWFGCQEFQTLGACLMSIPVPLIVFHNNSSINVQVRVFLKSV